MKDDRERELVEALFDESAGEGPAELSGELEELRETEGFLEQAASEERASLLAEGRDPLLEERAAESLQRIMVGGRRPSLGRLMPLLLVGAVAAAALLIVFLRPTQTGPEEPLPLGPEEVVLEAPLGQGDEYGTFRWKGEFPAGGWFELKIWESGAALDAPSTVERELQEPRWIPEDPASLPDSLRWEVRAWSSGGELVGSDRGEASRSSP